MPKLYRVPFACIFLLLLAFGWVVVCGNSPLATSISKLDINIAADSRASTIQVHISNPGPNVVRLWKGANSWAWFNITFVLFHNGSSYYIQKNPNEGFTRNGPVYAELKKSESLDLNVNPFEPGWVKSKDAPKKFAKGDTLICIYHIDPTLESSTNGVWVGTVIAKSEITD